MQTITVFDTSKHHIFLRCWFFPSSEVPLAFRAVLDTGASKTEISANFLCNLGVLETAPIKTSSP
jgi:hypothetical protein